MLPLEARRRRRLEARAGSREGERGARAPGRRARACAGRRARWLLISIPWATQAGPAAIPPSSQAAVGESGTGASHAHPQAAQGRTAPHRSAAPICPARAPRPACVARRARAPLPAPLLPHAAAGSAGSRPGGQARFSPSPPLQA